MYHTYHYDQLGQGLSLGSHYEMGGALFTFVSNVASGWG